MTLYERDPTFHALVQKAAKGGTEGIKNAFKDVTRMLEQQDIKALRGTVT